MFLPSPFTWTTIITWYFYCQLLSELPTLAKRQSNIRHVAKSTLSLAELTTHTHIHTISLALSLSKQAHTHSHALAHMGPSNNLHFSWGRTLLRTIIMRFATEKPKGWNSVFPPGDGSSVFSSSSSQSQIESWPEAEFFQPCADGQLLSIVHIVVDVVDVLVVVGVVVVVVVVVIVNSWALNHSFYAIKMPFSCLLYGCFSTSPTSHYYKVLEKFLGLVGLMW